MKLYTIGELVDVFYEDNLHHFKTAYDCDCHLHKTLTTTVDYWENYDA